MSSSVPASSSSLAWLAAAAKAAANQPAAAPSSTPPYATLPSGLGISASMNFSQILTDQLFNHSTDTSSASLLGLPFSSELTGLSSGLGASTTASTSSSSSMLETLMALSLVMIVERLTDSATPSTTAAATATDAGATSPATTADAPNIKWPVAGRITQDFHPGHTGTDIAVPTGTPVPTTLAGKVIYAGWNTEGYGNLVIVENGPYRTYYAHLSQIGVKVGQQVAAGARLGLSGSTGNSTGPHLHYEVRVNGTPVGPQALP